MENLYQVSEVKLMYQTKQKASERPKIIDSKTTYDLLLKCFDAEKPDKNKQISGFSINGIL
jgi:hypothetical protein